MVPANDVIACAVAQPHAKARRAQSAAGKCVAGMSMGEVDVVSDVKALQRPSLGVGMDARRPLSSTGDGVLRNATTRRLAECDRS